MTVKYEVSYVKRCDKHLNAASSKWFLRYNIARKVNRHYAIKG